jgi:hypothetical protein
MNWLKSAALESWRTTILGFVMAVGIVLQPVLAAGQVPTKSQVLAAVCVALAGLIAGDHKTGNQNQPPAAS